MNIIFLVLLVVFDVFLILFIGHTCVTISTDQIIIKTFGRRFNWKRNIKP
jgi:hypothetical protein